jgi:hypothetical protein
MYLYHVPFYAIIYHGIVSKKAMDKMGIRSQSRAHARIVAEPLYACVT